MIIVHWDVIKWNNIEVIFIAYLELVLKVFDMKQKAQESNSPHFCMIKTFASIVSKKTISFIL